MTGERSARAREERLAKALKANLSRRKGQARARDAARRGAEPEDPAEAAGRPVDAQKPQGSGG
jgi:hypothetical protein